jgi:DnaA regulatory inactivator Hda
LASSRDKATQLPLALDHNVALGVEDFLVAPSNRLAVDWIERWPDWPFTALVLVGPRGSGKTHLAQLWRARTGAQPVDCRAVDVAQAAELAERTGVAWVDDADRLSGDPAAEAMLLHLYNLLQASGGGLLLTADRPPSGWRLGLPDLGSRLNTAMVVEIGPPDDALLASVAVKLFADRQLEVGEDVITLLVTRGERSLAWIARAVDALDRAALAAKRPVTAPLARDILAAMGEAPA